MLVSKGIKIDDLFILLLISSFFDWRERLNIIECIIKIVDNPIYLNDNFKKFLLSPPMKDSICSISTKLGNILFVKWGHENGCLLDMYTYILDADNGCSLDERIWAGHLDIIKLAYSKDLIKFDKRTCALSLYCGNLDILKWLLSEGCPLNGNCFSVAAGIGNLEMIQYLLDINCPKSNYVCEYAAAGGHLKCLIFLHENNFLWCENTCSSAAEKGHLHCLEYAHNNGCSWDAYTCSSAASYGHLDCLIYAYEHGCEIDIWIYNNAKKYNHTNCLDWLEKEGIINKLLTSDD